MKKIAFMILLATIHLPCFSATIQLKSGKTVEGKTIEKTDEYIKIEYYGIPLTYYFDEIESIDGEIVSITKNETRSLTLPETPKDIFQSVSPAAVFISKETAIGADALGSGFIISSDGVIVTNYHVISFAKDINVKLKNGDTYPVIGVINYDPLNDFAILKIDARNLPSVILGDSSQIGIGEKIYCIGNPLGLEYTFSDGMISGLRNFNEIAWFQFTAPVSPGSSGGPVINSEGKIIGIVTSGAEEGQNLNFALPINAIKEHIKTAPIMTFKEFTETVTKADIYTAEGTKSLFEGNISQAFDYYLKAVKENPNSLVANNQLGFLYNNIGKYEKALPYLEKAFGINPNDEVVLTNLGLALTQLGSSQRAIEHLQRAIKINPNFASAYNNLGLAYSSLGQHKQAIPYLEKSIEVNPYLAEPYYNLAICLGNLGDYQTAIDYLGKALSIKPTKPDIYAALGQIYYALGDYAEANKNFRKAKELFQASEDYESVQQIEGLLREIQRQNNIK